MSDRNLYSFSGPKDNGRVIDWTSGPLPGSDINSFSVKDHWEDTLKFSTWLQDLQMDASVVNGGLEDCADFNNGCANIRLRVDQLCSGGKYVTTVKGGCTGIDIRGCVIKGGSEVDHDYGNWSDQSSKKTTGNILGTWKPDGSPVTVRCLNADKPMLVPGTGPYVFIFPKPETWYHGIAVWLFLTSRRLKLWR